MSLRNKKLRNVLRHLCRILPIVACTMAALALALTLRQVIFCPLTDELPIALVDSQEISRSNALSQSFLLLGIINFTLSYMVTARNSTKYDIPLRDVFEQEFRKVGLSYIAYGVLILCGMCLAAVGCLWGVFACIVGIIISAIPMMSVAYIFAFRTEKAVYFIEDYLKNFSDKKMSTAGDGTEQRAKRNHKFFQTSTFIRAYYLETDTISRGATSALLGMINDMPFIKGKGADEREIYLVKQQLKFFVYTFSSQDEGQTIQNSNRETVETVMLVRLAVERMLRGLTQRQQADLLRKLLEAAGDTVLSVNIPKYLPSEELISNTQRGPFILLCGISAYLCSCMCWGANGEANAKSWDELLNVLVAIALYSDYKRDELKNRTQFRTLYCNLALLLEATSLAEICSIETTEAEEILKLFGRTMERMSIDSSILPEYFPFGQMILLTSDNKEYDPERSYLRAYDMFAQLKSFLIERDTKYNEK